MKLESLLTFKISLIAKLVERQLTRVVGEFGLTAAEYRVLGQVMLHPKSTVRAIAARTLVDKAQVSRAVAALEAQSLISRSVPSTDRRSPVLTTTAAGRALIRKIAPLRQAGEDKVLARLDPDAVAVFRTTLDDLFEIYSESSGTPAAPTPTQRRRAIRSGRLNQS